ncbi:MAG TPA: nuclease-related domain-containing protein [Jatrophihabitans sp.]|nr:nuclease-related domain-containing protein [Jatrophihabitans sp.]
MTAEANQLAGEAENWERGAEGEERVGALLDRADRATTRVLHDRLLRPGTSKTNLDHLVVGPAGIHLVDTKNWGGRVALYEGALMQHWTGLQGPEHRNCKRDLAQLAGLAAQVARRTGRAVTPVLCLAGPQSGRFAPTEVVPGLHVVPADGLLDWLARQPSVLPAEEVHTLAVELSVTFPPAVGGALSQELLAPSVDGRASRITGSGKGRGGGRSGRGGRIAAPRRPPGASSRARRAETSTVRALLALAVVVGVLAGGVALVRSVGHSAAALAHQPGANAAGSGPVSLSAPPLSTARRQALADWAVRAGLYRDSVKPAGLYSDAVLPSFAGQCTARLDELGPLRPGLVHTPDAGLTAAARRYDAAARQYLDACRHDRPAALHRADGALSAAATEVNLRYNRLLGRDPAGVGAARVL